MTASPHQQQHTGARRFEAITRITHVQPDRVTESRLAMTKLLGVMERVWEPADICFTIATTEEGLAAYWTVRGDDEARVRRLARSIRIAGAQVAPWFGWSEVCEIGPSSPDLPKRFALRHDPGGGTHVVSNNTLAWYAAATHCAPGPWQLELNLHGFTRDARALWIDEGTDEEAERQPPGVWVSMSLSGPSEDSELIASLIAEDSFGDTGMRAVPHCRGASDPEIMPPELVAHVLSTPARAPRIMPAWEPTQEEAIFTIIESSSSPHVWTLGMPGSGKSVLQEHLLTRALQSGRSVIVVDVHDGRAVDVIEEQCRLLGLEPAVLRAGESDDTGQVPCMSITRPPVGVDPRDHAVAMATLIVDEAHGDRMRPDFAGPVGFKSLCLALTALSMDPAKPPATIADYSTLLDPSDGVTLRRDLFTRIGDLTLATAWMHEVMPMGASRDPGNAMIWQTSKVDPLLSTPAAAAFFCGRGREFELERLLSQGRTILIHAPEAVLGSVGARAAWRMIGHRIAAWTMGGRLGAEYDFALDEWQLNPSPTIRRMLAEVRKFGMRVLLSNQSTTQIPSDFRHEALANVGTIVTFTSSPADAALLESLFPTVAATTLQRLPRHHAAVTCRERDLVALTPPPLPRPTRRVKDSEASPFSPRPESGGTRLPSHDPRWDELLGPRGPRSSSGSLEEWLRSRRSDVD